jgi:hypothetical protein
MRFLLFIAMLIIVLLILNKISKATKRAVAVIILPWIAYALTIFLFQVKFRTNSLEALTALAILISSSACFFVLGYKFKFFTQGTNHNLIKEFPANPQKNHQRLLYILLSLGFIGGIYSTIEQFQRLPSIDAILTFDLYAIRTNNNTNSELENRGILSLVSRLLLSLCFIAFCITKKDILTVKQLFLAYGCITIVFIFALLTAGRLFILYYIVGFFIFKYINREKILKWQLFSIALTITAMVAMFFYRAPTDAADVRLFYMNLLRIESADFILTLGNTSHAFEDALTITALYFVHSFGILGDFYQFSSFSAYAFGGYTFNLLYRMLNDIFSINLAVIQDYWLDPSVGLYATFARDALADFGLAGSMISTACFSFISGFSFLRRNSNWIYRTLAYWGFIHFFIAPMLSVLSSGLINIMYLILIVLLMALAFLKGVTRVVRP